MFRSLMMCPSPSKVPVKLVVEFPTGTKPALPSDWMAADCSAYAVADFHKDHLRGKTLAIACPKLDEGKDIYREKLTALIDHAQINTLTVVMMEVPCCRGLDIMVREALQKSGKDIPLESITIGINGERRN